LPLTGLSGERDDRRRPAAIAESLHDGRGRKAANN
jgi:hypothetical protein